MKRKEIKAFLLERNGIATGASRSVEEGKRLLLAGSPRCPGQAKPSGKVAQRPLTD
jgi:hypothetical protein